MNDSSDKRGSPPAAGRPSTRFRIKRVLNTRLLVETLIVAAVIGPAAYFWSWWQSKRMADAMLERAGRLAGQKDDLAAAQYYFQYLKLRPDDADVQVRLAESYDRAAKDMAGKPQAVEYYYQALGVAPPDKQRELRRRLAELLIELRRFVPAEEEARELLKHEPNDPQALRLAALAVYGQSRAGALAGGRSLTLAGEACGNALKVNPGDVEVAVVLARIYREQPQLLSEPQQALSDAERQRLADGVMDAMLAANPQSAKARLAHYGYRSRYRLANPKEDLAAALKSNPDDLQVVLLAAYQAQRDAESARRKGDSQQAQACFDQACRHYRRAIDISPSDETAYAGLGDLYFRQGNSKDALETLRHGLEKGKKDSIELNSRLAELLITQGQLEEADKTIRGLELTGERLGPRLPLPAKLSLKRGNDYLRAKWLVAKRQYLEAIPLLRRVAVGQQTGAEAARSLQAWQWLARAYAAIGQWDQAAAAYEQAAALEPTIGWLQSLAAEAWTAAGRLDAAETHYEQALSLGAPPDTWRALAGVRLQRQIRLPKTARNWDPFNKAMTEAKKAQEKKPPTDPWRLTLIEAEYLVARGEQMGQAAKAIHDAVELCRNAEREHPDAPDLLLALVAAYQQLDQPADADRVVKQLEGMKGQAAAACLCRARLDISRKGYDEARKALTHGLETLPEEARPALRRELIQLELRAGRPDQARRQLLALHEKEPTSRDWVTRLAELAFELGKLDEVEQWENELRKLEGPDGFFWRYYRARRLLAQVGGPDDAKLAEASQLQTFIQNQRPSWPRTYMLQGLLSETVGNFEQAADAYKEAIRLGERTPLAYQRLISLLLQTGRAEEADHYLLLMQDQIAPAESLSSLEMVVAARRGQIDRALDAARRGAQQRPKDPLAYLWLGQMLLAADKSGEAETTLKKAATMAPDDVRTLSGLFGFYVRAKQLDRARETLQTVLKNEKLNKAQRASVLAQGYELLGDKGQAEANYREAARLEPDDATPQLRLAGYLLRSGADPQRQEPEQLLRGVLNRWPNSGPARRMLAELLVERGGEPQWQEARRLVEEAGKDAATPEVNRRVQAMLLMRRGGKENLDKAAQILEELVLDPKRAAPSDRLWLARLYESDGKLDPARQQYLKLVGGEKPDAAHLASYVELLLRYNRFDEADPWLKKLEGLLPDNLGAAALRARWFRGKGQPEKIELLVEPLAEKLSKRPAKAKPPEAELDFAVGRLYASVEQYSAAERWYRRLIAAAPERFEPLAILLAQQGRIGEAVEMCRDAARSNHGARPATTLALALLSGKPSAEEFRMAEPILTKAAADHKDDVDLLSALAGVRVSQQRIDEAVQLFRQVLALKPSHVDALNNFATLLAEQPDKRQESLEYVDRALGIVGPQPGLLDTKGMILVFQKKLDEALPLLEEAAATPQADPRYHFHLAVAYDRAGKAEKARTALRTARKNHLASQILTPQDRQMLAELEKKFD